MNKILSITYALATAYVLFFPQITSAQLIAGSLSPQVDTNYVKLTYDSWSLRTVSTYKHQNIFFSNTNGKTIKYVPHDRTSVGIGLSYKFLIVDAGIRLLFNRTEFTKRFDIQAEVAFQSHLIDFTVQRYEGFDKIVPEGHTSFRKDIKSWVIGLNYLYNFNNDKLSVRSVITGNRIQTKAAGTFLIGGFFSLQDIDADTLLVSSNDGNYNEFAEIQNASFNNAGILAGYAFATPITKHLFFFGGVMPGVGLNFGHVDGTNSYDLRVSPMAKVNTRSALGYIQSRWYAGLHYSSDYYIISLQNDNYFRYNIGKFKVLFGYRFSAKDTVFEKILGK